MKLRYRLILFFLHYNEDMKIFTFTFGAFGRRFYPKRLIKSTFVERDSNISLWYIKIRIEQVSGIHSYEANRMPLK